jgi:uncharacterized protein
MEAVKVIVNDHGVGEVQLFLDDVKAGKMDIAVRKEKLTVYHTEVLPEFEGRGLAKLLLNELVSYAKANGLKIIPLCPYVHAQFKRHPELYDAIWSKEEQH